MLLDEVGEFIEQAGFGQIGVNIFKGELPLNPISSIGLFEISGTTPASTLDLEIAHEFPELRVITRHSTYIAARARAESIMKLLATIKNTHLHGTFYLTIQPRTTPYTLEVDANKNHLIAVHYNVMKVVS
jgi:hypothetical protein